MIILPIVVGGIFLCISLLMHYKVLLKSYKNEAVIRGESWESILIGEEEKPAPITRTEGTTTIPILVYHKFRARNATTTQSALAKAFSVDENVFDQQLQYLEDEHYTVLTMRELVEDERNHEVPAKPAVITFDDGWRGQYTVALPLLEKHHMRGTFYIYTDVIGDNAFMTMDNLRSLVQANMEIGDHTKTHPRLTKADPRKLSDELLSSKQFLEKNLHIQITDMAYPYGSYNDAVISAVKEYGYLSGRTSNHSLFNDFKDPYRLNVVYAPKSLEGFKKLLQN